MGFKLAPHIRRSMKEKSRKTLMNKTIAIDAFNEMYKFIGFANKRPVGEVMIAFLQRTVRLIELGIRPVYAFEIADDWGKSFRDNRVNRVMDSSFSEQVISSGVQIAGHIGLPIVRAPWDGEAQAAHIVNKGDAWAAASEDYDTLLFGAKRMVIKAIGMERPIVIELEDVLSELGVSLDQLIDASIIAGNDYYAGIKGIGVKTALEIIRKHDSLEKISEINLYVCGAWIDVKSNDFNRVRDIFKNPSVKSDYELEWTKPQYGLLRSYMVDDLGCDAHAVDETISRLKRASGGKKQTSIDAFS